MPKGLITTSEGKLVPNTAAFRKGAVPWNKGKRCPQLILSKASRAKKSASLRAVGAGKWRKGMTPWNKGLTSQDDLRVASGDKASGWKGGVTARVRGIRWSKEYYQWRRKVFERDDYTCRFCRRRGYRLNADHIKPVLHYPELIFDVNNGRTLCENCHRKTPTYGTRARSLAIL